MPDNNAISVKIFNSTENKVLKLSLEYIVKLIITSKYKEIFHEEFLKTLAIIYRTKIVRKMHMYGGSGCSRNEKCDICDNHCIEIQYENELKEIFGDNYHDIYNLVSKAVDATEDKIICFNNNPIDAKITDVCGGSTQNSENVLPNKISYLRRVFCEYCGNVDNLRSVKELDMEEIEKKLKIKFLKKTKIDVNKSGFIEDIKVDEGGRVLNIKIGDDVFSGTELIELLGLDSTKLIIQPSMIKFTSLGIGDGLGLCLNGANEMSKQGYSYKDIIKYYYTGVEVSKLNKPCIKEPLKGKIIMVDPGHGGADSEDNFGITGLRERDVVLEISRKLSEKLVELGSEVILTRNQDDYVSLSERSKLANKIRPHFFISIHLNSFKNTTIRGCEIYHYRKDKEAISLSENIMRSLCENLDVINRGIKVSDFFLLREIGVTCLHLEVNYITNPEVEKQLKDHKYLEAIAQCICKGIVDFCLI